MKSSLPWYEHAADSHEHGKFMMLRVRFGWAGEGRFWALNGMIASADGCTIDLGKASERFRVAGTLAMTVDELDTFIDFLADPAQCGLVIRDGTTITTETVQACFERAEKKRKLGRKRKSDQRTSSSKNDDVTQDNDDVTRDNAKVDRDIEHTNTNTDISSSIEEGAAVAATGVSDVSENEILHPLPTEFSESGEAAQQKSSAAEATPPIVPKKQPDPSIDAVLAGIRDITGLPAGGKKQRIHVSNLLRLFRREFPDRDPVDTYRALVTTACQLGGYFAGWAAKPDDLYYNWQKIVSAARARGSPTVSGKPVINSIKSFS